MNEWSPSPDGKAVIHLLGNLGHALMREYGRSRRLVCPLVGRWQGLWGRRNDQKSLWTALPQAARGWSAYSGYPLDDFDMMVLVATNWVCGFVSYVLKTRKNCAGRQVLRENGMATVKHPCVIRISAWQ